MSQSTQPLTPSFILEHRSKSFNSNDLEYNYLRIWFGPLTAKEIMARVDMNHHMTKFSRRNVLSATTPNNFKEEFSMKKLLSIIFAALIGTSLSMATFAQTTPEAKPETKKEEKKKAKKTKKSEKPKEEKKEETK